LRRALDGTDDEDQTMRGGALTVAVALLAGLVALVLLYPAAIVDTVPQQCSSMVGLGAPCDAGLAVPGAAATAGIVGLLLWLRDRRRRPRAGS
jgi:hypothetical protein